MYHTVQRRKVNFGEIFYFLFLVPKPLVDQGLLIIDLVVTLTYTTLRRTSLDGWSARHRAFYQITHYTHKGETSMPTAGF